MENPKRNWGKEIKDVGKLIIIIGAIMVALVFYLFIGDSNSILAYLIDDHIFFLSVGGGLLLIIGIITRSIGKSKESAAESASSNQEEK